MSKLSKNIRSIWRGEIIHECREISGEYVQADC